MKQLDRSVGSKVFPVLMARATCWFRWPALVTVVRACASFGRFYLRTRATRANPARAWRQFGGWLLVWIAAYALICRFQLPS